MKAKPEGRLKVKVNVVSLLLLQILSAIENYQYSRMKILHMNFSILVNIL